MDQQRVELELQSQQLRQQLKRWECGWADANGGRKPSREIIKNNPDIARKYKRYNRLRDMLAGNMPPSAPFSTEPPDQDSSIRKRKPPSAVAPFETPSKRAKVAATPCRDTRQLPFSPAGSNAGAASPTRKLFATPLATLPTSIGPTPQKDGRVLGLFDLLGRTPNKPAVGPSPTSRSSAATPTSRRVSCVATTPPSSRRGDGAKAQKTPSTRTPAFLRRRTGLLTWLGGNDESDGGRVPPLRLPRKPLRGLSSVVASLRKMENDAMDEELDVMRELEMEADRPQRPCGGERNPPAEESARPGAGRPAGRTVSELEPVVEAEHSQTCLARPGGFDDEDAWDGPDDREGKDRDGRPMRVFKKKGQKRTTRKSNMRPARTRRPVEQESEGEGGSEGGSEGAVEGAVADRAVPETKVDASRHVPEQDAPTSSGSESDGLDGEDEGGRRKKKKKKEQTGRKEKEGTVKKTARKVKATANANFKRLKLRNYGAKGGPGHNSRFRRRR